MFAETGLTALRALAVKLTNFRCYPSLEISMDSDLVLITGHNGAGKTSILEAVSVISSLKSFRGAKDQTMVQWSQDFYSIQLRYRISAGEEEVRLAYGKNPGTSGPMQRKITLNREQVIKSADLLGRFRSVVFSPDDISIVDSAPGVRRKFFDLILSTMYPAYFSALRHYQKSLDMRSSLLKSGEKRADVFDAIESEMAIHGASLQAYRLEFAKKYSQPFGEYIEQISGGKDSWTLVYRPSVEGGEQTEIFRAAMQSRRGKDFVVKQNTAGVQRDLWKIENPQSGQDLSDIASQGQKRTAALSLKMSQYAYYTRVTRQIPVLLIDDVLNELDLSRRKQFIQFLHKTGQAIVTTTDVTGMEDFLEERAGRTSITHYEISGDNIPVARRLL